MKVNGKEIENKIQKTKFKQSNNSNRSARLQICPVGRGEESVA
jgi:hypothetical protein